jgi:hypothetical protein
MRNRARYGAVIGAILLQVPSLPVRHAAGVGSGGSGGQRSRCGPPFRSDQRDGSTRTGRSCAGWISVGPMIFETG